MFRLIFIALTGLAATAATVIPRDNDKYSPSSEPQFEYLFTINYKFGGASPIIFSQGVVENGKAGCAPGEQPLMRQQTHSLALPSPAQL